MDIEDSSLYREVQAIVNDTAKPVHYAWQAQIHVGNNTYTPLKVLSIDFVCDYELKYADDIILTVSIPGGTYAKQIYPNKSNIDITLLKQPLTEAGDIIDPNQTPQSERYTATLIDKGNPMLEANGMNTPTEDTLNMTNIFEVQFQLVNKALEQLRMIAVGGIYRNCTVGDVITGIMTKESTQVKVDGVRMPQGVNMVPANNTAKRDHVIIPQGIKLVNVPEYVQRQCGGVYSAGLGYYLQGDYWYVYPCYDPTRATSTSNTLTLINVPQNKFPGIERTYRLNGNNVIAMATGQVSFKDDADVQQLNHGNGTRFADATKVMESFTTTVNNKTIMSRGANNSEFTSVTRPNGNNNVPVSNQPINANPYLQFSQLARRNGSFLHLVWENSDPTKLFPGMVVQLLYLNESTVSTVSGVVLKVHHYVHLKEKGFTATRHTCNTALSLFVQRQTQ